MDPDLLGMNLSEYIDRDGDGDGDWLALIKRLIRDSREMIGVFIDGGGLRLEEEFAGGVTLLALGSSIECFDLFLFFFFRFNLSVET